MIRILHLILAAFALFAGPTAYGAPARISVTVEGKGPDVILIPGLASSRSVFDALAARLRPTHRLHRVQIAGFAGDAAGGNASGEVVAPVAEDIAAYVEAQKLKSPAVIGHSLGGEVGLMLAARHPALVGKLMSIDALPFFPLVMDPNATVESARPQAEGFRAMLANQSAEQAAQAQAQTMVRLVKTEAARPALVAAGAASDRDVVARATYELMTTDLRPELGRIKAPLTVLYAYDAMYGVPAEAIDARFEAAYSNARAAMLERVDGSFHFVMIDQPEAFAAAVDRFLAAK